MYWTKIIKTAFAIPGYNIEDVDKVYTITTNDEEDIDRRIQAWLAKDISKENLNLKNSQADKLTMMLIREVNKFKGRRKKQGVIIKAKRPPLNIFVLSIFK